MLRLLLLFRTQGRHALRAAANDDHVPFLTTSLPGRPGKLVQAQVLTSPNWAES